MPVNICKTSGDPENFMKALSANRRTASPDRMRPAQRVVFVVVMMMSPHRHQRILGTILLLEI